MLQDRDKNLLPVCILIAHPLPGFLLPRWFIGDGVKVNECTIKEGTVFFPTWLFLVVSFSTLKLCGCVVPGVGPLIDKMSYIVGAIFLLREKP